MAQRGGKRERSRQRREQQHRWRARSHHLSGNRSSDRIPSDEVSPELVLDAPGTETSGESNSWLSTILTALALVITALVVSGSTPF